MPNGGFSPLGYATQGGKAGQVAELVWVNGAEVGRTVSSLTTQGFDCRKSTRATNGHRC